MSFDAITWIWIPGLIFLARILDVSIGTLRIIFSTKGYRVVSSALAFVEVTIWLIAIRHILLNITNIAAFLGYALGYSAGTYLGVLIEEKLSVGRVMIRIVTKKKANKLIKELSKTNYSITHIDAQSNNGKVKVIFMFIKRKQVPKITSIINEFSPKANYTVEDIRYGTEETIPTIQHKHPHYSKNLQRK